MNDNFTDEQIAAARATRDAIIKENVSELKSVYMAGEIVMWADMKDKSNSDKQKIVLCGYCKTPIHKDAYGGELKGIGSFHTNCHIAEEMQKQYPLVKDSQKILGEGFVKKILTLYTKEEISFGRMVELFNEQI